MKKIISFLLVLISIIGVFNINVQAQKPISVVIDGQAVSFPDAQPFIDENSRTLVPLRFVAEQLGAQVEWDEATRGITLKKGNDVVKLKIDDTKVEINGIISILDTKPILKDERTFVPLRFSANALRASVEWDDAARTAQISTTSMFSQLAQQIPELSYFTGSQYNLTANYGLQMPKQNDLSVINVVKTYDATILSVNDYSEKTLDVAKRIVKIYYPTEYEKVWELFMDSVKNRVEHENVRFDNRRVVTMLASRRTGILIGDIGH